MSSQIMHPMFTTTRVRRALPKKPLTVSQKKHQAFIVSVTKGGVKDKALMNKQFRQTYRDTMIPDRSDYKSAGFGGSSDSCANKSILNRNRLDKETPEIQKAILEKAARVGPLFSKGPIQYITDATDLKTLGRKV